MCTLKIGHNFTFNALLYVRYIFNLIVLADIKKSTFCDMLYVGRNNPDSLEERHVVHSTFIFIPKYGKQIRM
jgi:hypothetical protein